MASGCSAETFFEEAGVVLHQAVNDLRSNIRSVVKITKDYVKNIVGWIAKLIRYTPQLDHEARELFEKLGEELEKLKSDGSRVLLSFKALAEVASDEYKISCIKKEVKQRSGGSIRRALVYVRDKFSRNSSTNSELEVFLSSLHDHILTCTDAMNVFYRHYDSLSGDIERVIDAKKSKLCELKKNVERNAIASGATSKVSTSGWISTVIFGAAAVLTVGAAAALIPAAGFAACGVVGVFGSTISKRALDIALSEHKYLEDILLEIVGLKKEMNIMKTSVKKMGCSMNNVQDVLNGQLNHYTKQSFYRDAEREDIEASLDDLQDYMQDLIEDIESCEWQLQ